MRQSYIFFTSGKFTHTRAASIVISDVKKIMIIIKIIFNYERTNSP
jgi:hypothetical protein